MAGRALGVAMSSLGNTAGEAVGMHGSESVQATAIATFVSGTAATTATYGGSVGPDIVALAAAVNAIIVALRNKGITAT
jgi:hypothetical protein